MLQGSPPKETEPEMFAILKKIMDCHPLEDHKYPEYLLLKRKSEATNLGVKTLNTGWLFKIERRRSDAAALCGRSSSPGKASRAPAAPSPGRGQAGGGRQLARFKYHHPIHQMPGTTRAGEPRRGPPAHTPTGPAQPATRAHPPRSEVTPGPSRKFRIKTRAPKRTGLGAELEPGTRPRQST